MLLGNLGGNAQRTRHIFNKAFLEALANDFREGGPQAIAKVRKYQPAAYMKICALLVPRELQVEHSGGVKAMTDEQIDRAIAYIEEQLAKRAVGENAKGRRPEAAAPRCPRPKVSLSKNPRTGRAPFRCT